LRVRVRVKDYGFALLRLLPQSNAFCLLNARLQVGGGGDLLAWRSILN